MAQNYCSITWVNTVYTNWCLNMKASKTSVRQLQQHCCVWTMRSIMWKTQFFHPSRSQRRVPGTRWKMTQLSRNCYLTKADGWNVTHLTLEFINYTYSKSYLLDLVLVLGLYSWDSSSMPFCLLYQSNKVRKIEGRQYSESELIELITYWENTTNQQMECCSSFLSSLKRVLIQWFFLFFIHFLRTLV